MKFSRETKLLGGAILALTLGTKLLASRPEAKTDQSLLGSAIESSLRRAGYEARAERRKLGIAVTGRKGACDLMVREYDPHGTMANVIDEVSSAYPSLRFVYRGTVYESAPKALPLTEYLVKRELQRVGIRAPRAPILAVAATTACPLQDIPWSEVATVER